MDDLSMLPSWAGRRPASADEDLQLPGDEQGEDARSALPRGVRRRPAQARSRSRDLVLLLMVAMLAIAAGIAAAYFVI